MYYNERAIRRLVGLAKLMDVLIVDVFYLVYEWRQYGMAGFYAPFATLSWTLQHLHHPFLFETLHFIVLRHFRSIKSLHKTAIISHKSQSNNESVQVKRSLLQPVNSSPSKLP
jgi:hypothetical protein